MQIEEHVVPIVHHKPEHIGIYAPGDELYTLSVYYLWIFNDKIWLFSTTVIWKRFTTRLYGNMFGYYILWFIKTLKILDEQS